MTSKHYSGLLLIYANAAGKCLCLLIDVCMKRGKKNLSKWLSSTIVHKKKYKYIVVHYVNRMSSEDNLKLYVWNIDPNLI